MPPKAKAKEPDKKPLKGIFKHLGLYKSRLWTGDRDLYLGHHATQEKAAAVYDRAVIHLRGPIASKYCINNNIALYQNQVDKLMIISLEQLLNEIRWGGCERWMPPDSPEEKQYMAKLAGGGRASSPRPKKK